MYRYSVNQAVHLQRRCASRRHDVIVTYVFVSRKCKVLRKAIEYSDVIVAMRYRIGDLHITCT